jgi:Zn-dependent M28 family amino/carboxypeptidase
VVEKISIPRHFFAESNNNKFVADWIAEELNSYGYKTSYQGRYRNVVAVPKEKINDSVILIGAHYDSVPGTPGADDNASAVAAMLACAKAISEYAQDAPVCFVAFNCEEDGLIGSTDFVNSFLPESGLKIGEVHIWLTKFLKTQRHIFLNFPSSD